MPVNMMAILAIFTMELGRPSSAQLPVTVGGGHHIFYPNMSIVTAIPSHPINLYEITNDGENHMKFGWQGGGNQQNYNVNRIRTSPLLPSAKSLRVEWPVKRACEIPGDVVLGGLMMVHEREDSVICGPVMPQGALANALKEIRRSLLEKVQARQAAKAVELLTRNPVENKRPYELTRLPELARLLRNIFITEKKNILAKPVILTKMCESFREIMDQSEVVHHNELLRETVPGIQAVETMLYTLDIINNRSEYFKIGAHILDDCDKDTYGLEMAVDFIKGSISNLDDAEPTCNKTARARKVISGVVGAASSVTSVQVANLLRLFKIPQVSYFSTSPELSNKQRFEYFTRTIPSDHHQVQAMVELVKRLGWSYVSIIYEESNYGIKAFEELEVLLDKHGVCIAVKEKLVKDSGVAEDNVYDSIIVKLQTKPRAKGVIIFGSDQEVAELMRAVKRCNATGSFSWIGSDGWSARDLVSNGNEAQVEGTLSVQPQANPVAGFEEYFLNLSVENNKRNPWFVEFWEDHFKCRYPNSTPTPYNIQFVRECSSKDRLTKSGIVFEKQLQFVSDAVTALSVALQDMHRDLCGNYKGICTKMNPTKGPELLRYLRKVSFQGLSGDKFHFDYNGDGPARYNIVHFKKMSSGNYQWVNVGQYIEGELLLNMSDIKFNTGSYIPPESVCSSPCSVGQPKKYVEGERCCWHCFNCSQYQVLDLEDETQCLACPGGTLPDINRQQCLPLPEVYLRVGSGWAIGAMSLSVIGIIITLFVVIVFARNNNTPIVKAAGRELSYVLLSGIFLCYSITFALVIRPSDIVCGIQRFGAGFCFTVVYAALFTKTNRIARIFKAGKRTIKRPSFISPRSQLIICGFLISLQIIINILWMIISPPKAIHHYPTREDNLLVCSSYIDASYMIAFTYPILLIVVCTVYAVLTRNIPEAFNESKHIGFTMYTTCIIWLAFVPLYFVTGNHMPLRITSMSVTISLSASVTVICLFSPKLYIILIKPERNVRQSMMQSRRSALRTGTSASVMVGTLPIAHPLVTSESLMKLQQQCSVDRPSLGEIKTLSGHISKATQTSPKTAMCDGFIKKELNCNNT